MCTLNNATFKPIIFLFIILVTLKVLFKSCRSTILSVANNKKNGHKNI